MRAVKRQIGNFNLEWKLKFFCREHGGESQCVICKKHIICKAYNVKRHYDCFHKEYKSYDGEERRHLYYQLLSSFEPLVKNATAENVKVQLKERIRSFVAISLAIDENIDDSSSTFQLVIFIRGIDKGLNITEELLDVIPMEGTTSAEDIFQCLKECAVRMGINWRKVVSIATDGARAMTECKSRVVTLIRGMLMMDNFYNDDDIVAIHCLIHQEDALCARSICLKNVRDVVQKCLHTIRAADLKQTHSKIFVELAGSEHTWLSRGKTLRRFFELREEISTFLVEEMLEPCPELCQPDWVADLAFMTDITQHLIVLRTALMEQNKIISQMSNEIDAFQMKLALWRRQIEERNFYFYPCLQTLPDQSINVFKYSAEIVKLEKQFEQRFSELQSLKQKFEIFATPFAADPYLSPNDFQMELIELKCDSRLKYDYKESASIVDFYKQLCPLKFAKLRAFAAKVIAMFGSTYVCEQFFLALNLNKSCARNRSNDCNLKEEQSFSSEIDIKPNISCEVDIKTSFSSEIDMKPDIDEININEYECK